MDLSQEDLEDDGDSENSAEITAVISPQKSTLVRDNLAQEKGNAKKAAKASAEHAKKDKANKKVSKGKKKTGASCAFPGHTDFVDLCDGMSKELGKQTNKVIDLLGGFLPGSQSNAAIMAEVEQCNIIINTLKENMRRAREDNGQDKIEDCGKRIKRYKRMQDNLEAKLFETENDVV